MAANLKLSGFDAGQRAAEQLPDEQLLDAVPWVCGYLTTVLARVEAETRWFLVECPECHWRGLSANCEGGNAIADTGDFSELLCPRCWHEREMESVVKES